MLTQATIVPIAELKVQGLMVTNQYRTLRRKGTCKVLDSLEDWTQNDMLRADPSRGLCTESAVAPGAAARSATSPLNPSGAGSLSDAHRRPSDRDSERGMPAATASEALRGESARGREVALQGLAREVAGTKGEIADLKQVVLGVAQAVAALQASVDALSPGKANGGVS